MRVTAALALCWWAVEAETREGGARLPSDGELPLRTRGRHVVDALGRPLRLACVNWYGAHLRQMVSTGLDVRPVADIASTVAELGFNCVRLPFSLDLVFENRSQVPHPARWLAANPELQSRSPLEVFDAVVAALTGAGLLVILNNHISSKGWCCGFRDDEGLWYTEMYPEAMWLESLGKMAARYRSDKRVVGFDLRNELRPSRTRVPDWGSENAETDWALAAEKGGARVVAENDNMLIVVSGLLYCMFLCDVPAHPLHLIPALRGRTVYTAHEYGMTSINLQVRARLARGLPLLVACHVCLWLPLLLSGICLEPTSSQDTRPEDGRLRRPRCSSRAGRCLSLAALLLPPATLLGVALSFSRYVPACGFSRQLPTLAAIAALALLLLLSLELWLLALVRQLASRCRRSGSGTPSQSPNAEREAATEMLEASQASLVPIWGVVGPAEEAPPPPRGAGASAPAERRGCWKAPRCSLHLIALAVTAAAAAAAAGVLLGFGSYEAFERELDSRWGFLVDGAEVRQEASAPVWLGEFGAAVEGSWWELMTRYLGDHEEVGWAYWSLNGDPKHPYMALLLEDSRTVRHPWKLQALQRLMASPSSAA